MKIKDLIKQLQQVENKDKYIHLLGNHTNGEDKDFDIFFNNIEVWDDGDESITLFMSHITENRFERWTWGKNAHSIIDHKKDGQVIKVYRTIKACDNNVYKLNNNN